MWCRGEHLLPKRSTEDATYQVVEHVRCQPISGRNHGAIVALHTQTDIRNGEDGSFHARGNATKRSKSSKYDVGAPVPMTAAQTRLYLGNLN